MLLLLLLLLLCRDKKEGLVCFETRRVYKDCRSAVNSLATLTSVNESIEAVVVLSSTIGSTIGSTIVAETDDCSVFCSIGCSSGCSSGCSVETRIE